MSEQDKWAVVYPGDPFPKGAVRALDRGLSCNDECVDSYVALWIHEKDGAGEAVFGKAINVDGKVEAYFTWGGETIKGSDTKGYRILTYIGNPKANGFKYHWVPARELNPNQLVYSGTCSPAVLTCSDGHERLGKCLYKDRVAFSAAHDGTETVHTQKEFEDCYLLCRHPV